MALWIEAEPVELRANATEEELQIVIRAVYRQVLGNVHVMDSQRLTSAESQLRNGDITVRGFVRAVAQSDLYRSLFFEPSSPYCFVELNFKHLLGRAPQDRTEVSDRVQLYNNQGYEAEIDSYIDSEEYVRGFGENIVPYAQGSRTQTGIKNVGFNRTFTLMRGFAANDIGKSAKLIGDLGGNLPTKIVAPRQGSGAYSNTGKRFRVVASKGNSNTLATRGTITYTVGYERLSQKIQNIHKTGGKILRVTEVA
ncbi:MAG: phycobilisome rod-core linker polypeptide [Cyanobacteriota bacterium]|nr:phycobilisome rod-core linker polypeptide [Cyanobacteriota bacterium]